MDPGFGERLELPVYWNPGDEDCVIPVEGAGTVGGARGKAVLAARLPSGAGSAITARIQSDEG